MAFLFGEHVISQDGKFYCRICQVQYSSYDAIYSHCQAAVHHSWCQACELMFLDEIELTEHLKDWEYHHFCPNCAGKMDYTDEEMLGAHRAEAHFWCQECDLLLASKRCFETHLIYEHAACEVCLEVFKDMELCRAHLTTHLHDEYRCPGCDNTAETFSAIIQHLESSSICGGFEEVMRLVRETPGSADFYIRSASGFDFHCKSCLLRWATLGELASHLEGTVDCMWLMGPDEAFSFLRDSLGQRQQRDSPSPD